MASRSKGGNKKTGLVQGVRCFGSQPWLQAYLCSEEPAATRKRPAAPLPALLPTLERDLSQGGGEWAPWEQRETACA